MRAVESNCEQLREVFGSYEQLRAVESSYKQLRAAQVAPYLERPDSCMTEVAVVAVAGDELLCWVPELSATPGSGLATPPGLMMRDVMSLV